jgi:hypothetical protein
MIAFFLAFWCDNNILTQQTVYNITSKSAPFSDFSRIFEGSPGENLTVAPYIINVNFKNLICVTKSLVQRQAYGRKDSNVAQIQITYTTTNGTSVLGSDGKVLTLTSPDDDPTIVEPSVRCNIEGIQFTILKTTDKLQPLFVRLMVIGCFAPGKHFST